MDSKKSLDSYEDIALHKISELVTKMHSFLLPKASTTSVYRDLNFQQERLLQNINTQSVIHSILAGCLAIDSCQQAIYQSQQMITLGLTKNLYSLINSYKPVQILLDSQYSVNQSLQKANKNINDNFYFLYHYLCQIQSSSKQKQQYLNKIKNIFQTKSRISTYENKMPEVPLLNFNHNNLDAVPDKSFLISQNKKLKEKLVMAENSIRQKQIQIFKLAQNRGHQSQQQKNQQSSQNPSNTQNPNSDLAHTSQNKQKEQIKKLKFLISDLKLENRTLHKQHYREKKQLLTQIQKLQEQLEYHEKHSDQELLVLIQDLQYQIEHLREERRKDQRIIMSIQSKFDNMRVSRNLRQRPSYRASYRDQDNLSSKIMKKSLISQKYNNPLAFSSHSGVFCRNSTERNPYSRYSRSRETYTQRSTSKRKASRLNNSPRFNPLSYEDQPIEPKMLFRKKPLQTTHIKTTAQKPKVHFDETFMQKKDQIRQLNNS